MADGFVGSAVIDRAGTGVTGYTYIDLNVAATCSGKLYKVDYWARAVAGAATFTVKVFRDDGTNYKYIGGEVFTGGIVGFKTFTFVNPISILKGDYIAVYTPPSGGANYAVVEVTTDAGSGARYNADVTSDIAKASWSAGTYTLSLYGYIRPPSRGFSGGQPWIFLKDMWEKHDRLWIPKLSEGYSY